MSGIQSFKLSVDCVAVADSLNMNDANKLRGLGAQVQGALDAYIESDDIANYKELQTRLRHLQIASSKDADTLYSFRLQV